MTESVACSGTSLPLFVDNSNTSALLEGGQIGLGLNRQNPPWCNRS